jgi:hypothetical protein
MDSKPDWSIVCVVDFPTVTLFTRSDSLFLIIKSNSKQIWRLTLIKFSSTLVVYCIIRQHFDF